jgi:hypothetical protein
MIEGEVLRIARPEQEWFEDVEDPEMVISLVVLEQWLRGIKSHREAVGERALVH